MNSNPLDAIAIHAYRNSFRNELWREIEESGDQKRIDTLKRDAMGMQISQWCEWAGYDICEIFYSALEDSNFHTLNAEIEKCIERDKKRR